MKSLSSTQFIITPFCIEYCKNKAATEHKTYHELQNCKYQKMNHLHAVFAG